MKIGCCAKIEEYEQVCKAGFDYIELAGKAVASLSESSFYELCTRISTSSIPCLAFNAYCSPEIVIAGPGFNHEKAREYAHNLAFRAYRLGVKVVNIGSPKSRILPPDFSIETANAQIRQFYSDTADEFAVYGIKVAVESLGYCFCNFVNKLSEAIDIVKDVSKDNLLLVLDFYNIQQNGEADVNISTAVPYICHVHDSDDAGSPWNRSYFNEGRSNIHIHQMKQLKDMGYDGTISVEVDVPFEPNAAQKSMNLIKSAWK